MKVAVKRVLWHIPEILQVEQVRSGSLVIDRVVLRDLLAVDVVSDRDDGFLRNDYHRRWIIIFTTGIIATFLTAVFTTRFFAAVGIRIRVGLRLWLRFRLRLWFRLWRQRNLVLDFAVKDNGGSFACCVIQINDHAASAILHQNICHADEEIELDCRLTDGGKQAGDVLVGF